MGEPSSRRQLPSTDIPQLEPEPEPPPMSSPILVRPQNNTKPMFRFSPTPSGSTLFDSFELRAVTNQLNKVMNGNNGCSSPALVSFLTSPFYNQLLDSIYMENTRTPRKVTCLRLASQDKRSSSSSIGNKGSGRGFVFKLWKKVKQGLFTRNKHRNEGK